MPELPFLQLPGARFGSDQQNVVVYKPDGTPRKVSLKALSKYLGDEATPDVPWGRVIPTSATVTGTGNDSQAAAQLLAQPIAGNAFQTLANAATAVYQFDKPATVTDTLVAFEFDSGVPATAFTVLLQKFNGSTWDTVVTWSSWIIENGVTLAGKADIIKLDKGVHDAAGTYRLSVTNNSGAQRTVRTPQIYRMPSSGTPPIVYVIGASIEDGDTRWVRWSAICAPLNIDVLCVNLAIGGYATAQITAAVLRWRATSWRPPINWAITHTLGNNITNYRPYSAQSEAYKTNLRADLNALMNALPDVRHTYSASTTFRDYRTGSLVKDGVYEDLGSKPCDEDINLPLIRQRQPYNINSDGRPLFDFYNLLLNNEEAWLGDGIHMNGTGAAGLDNWICQRWVDIYKKNRLDIVVVTNPIRQLTTDVFAFKASPVQSAVNGLLSRIWAIPAGSGGQAELITQMATTPLPIATVRPTVSGDNAVGSTATVSVGTWANSPLSYTYQWYADNVAIPGATASTYVTTEAEDTKLLDCEVTGINAAGYSSVRSSNNIVITVPLAPNQIPGLVYWADAEDDSSFTYGVAPAIAQWADKSGNGYNAVPSVVSQQPTRRQSPTDTEWEVFGDGVNDNFAITGMPTFLRDQAIEVVILTGANSDNQGALIGLTDPSGTNRHMYIFNWEDGTNPFLNIILAGTTHQRTLAGITAAYPAFDRTLPIMYSLRVEQGGGSAAIRINEAYESSLSVGTADMSTATWTLLSRNPVPGFIGYGPLRQVAIFNQTLTPRYRAALRLWLKDHGGAV